MEEIETLPISEKEVDKLIRNLVKTQSSIRTQLLHQKDARITFKNDNGEELWYDGIVKSYRRSNFEIQHAGEECTYIFTLAALEEDYISGELISYMTCPINSSGIYLLASVHYIPHTVYI